MGGGSSKEVEVREVIKTVEVVKEVESEESKKMRIMLQIDSQLASLKQQVEVVQPIITSEDGAIKIMKVVEDALVIRYSKLKDRELMLTNIQDLFSNSPALELVSDTATKMLSTLHHTNSMKEILRWHQQWCIKKVGKNVYGIEIHYKVTTLEEETGSVFSHKDTVLAIAYKCITHLMSDSAESMPDDEEVKKVKF